MSKKKNNQAEKLIDFKAVNPRYRGAMASDVVRALVTDPKVRARLEERWAKHEDASASGTEETI